MHYRSVVWVQSRDYWQESSGWPSMAANFEAAAHGVIVERIEILSAHLWKGSESRPVPEIDDCLAQQQHQGIRVRLGRETEVAHEPELLQDFGISGTIAEGIQELDGPARALRFTLETAPGAINGAEGRWQRIF